MSVTRITQRIPTNVITGFLGAGKTTVIRQLLAQRPAHERWAVLVNEFGEVGIDASLLEDGFSSDEERQLFITQVPGGCMCCANGVPMRIALNLLLARARPDRLLIEPTGLGHPKEFLAVLTGEYYESVLDVQATLTLIDARKVRDSRYTEHPTFNQQIEMADVLIANKADTYEPSDFPALLDYVDERFGLGSKPIYQVPHGAVRLQWLAEPAQHLPRGNRVELGSASDEPPQQLSAPRGGYVGAENKGEGFHSYGWVFDSEWQFDKTKLDSLLSGFEVERVKAVFLTDKGAIAYNKVDGVMSRWGMQDCADSRIELIAHSPELFAQIEQQLLACRLPLSQASESGLSHPSKTFSKQ